MLYHTLIQSVIIKITVYSVSFRSVDLVTARGPHFTLSSRWFINVRHHVQSQLTSCDIRHGLNDTEAGCFSHFLRFFTC